MNKRSGDKNMIILTILWIVLFAMLIYSNVHATETISKGKAELCDKVQSSSILGMISGEGAASILRNNDLEEAKEKAIETAKEEAILKVVGLYVNHEILSKEKANLLKVFNPKQNDIIDEYKIVSENRGEDGFYRVKIEAKIKEEDLKTLLIKNLYDDRIIVITSEKNMGKPLKRHILEHDLSRLAKEKGYNIVDYRTIKNKSVGDLVSSIRQGNTEAVKKIGVYYLTDLVIVGFVESQFSEQTKDIYSSHATGQVKIHQIGAKKEILSLTRHNRKGFGSDKEKAGIDAITKGSREMVMEATKGLPGKPLRKIKLTIRDIGNYASVKKTKSMVANIPYVKEVSEGRSDFNIEETTLYIKTTKGVDYIAEKISELRRFVVKKVSQGELSLEAGRP